ncbi:MAG: DNA primase small subunit PriS [Methanomassiliicoccales archaeon]|nr:MAG: DNA primase small subunit PriS [Methanomassiliicoccales archaeon]
MTKEQEFTMRWFREYYSGAEIAGPTEIEHREFGFMYFDKDFVRRHVGFKRPEDLRKYLSSQVPMHVYYSSALYDAPSAPKMEMKGWKGADLVFDLDADHIKGAGSMSYSEMLALVKKDMIRLLDDFLFGDMGFGEEDVRIVFSGGRGYHAHISDKKVLSLRSHERSEIVDYVSGTDLDLDWVFPQSAAMKKEFKTHTKVEKAVAVPESGAGGWRGHARRALEQLFDELRFMEPDGVKKRFPVLSKYKDQVVLGLHKELFGERPGDMLGYQLILANNSLEYVSDRYKEALLDLVRSEVRPRVAAEVDEPVTRDIKRLIRLPGSLHGKTGMRVIEMRRDQLTDFEPLRDAFPDIYPDDVVKVQVSSPVDVALKGVRFRGDGEMELPIYAALFMILRMRASLVP